MKTRHEISGRIDKTNQTVEELSSVCFFFPFTTVYVSIAISAIFIVLHLSSI